MNNKRLSKSKDRILLGVCGGIAEFLGWSKQTVRLLWVVLTVLGLGLLVYPILALIMPTESRGDFNLDDYQKE